MSLHRDCTFGTSNNLCKLGKTKFRSERIEAESSHFKRTCSSVWTCPHLHNRCSRGVRVHLPVSTAKLWDEVLIPHVLQSIIRFVLRHSTTVAQEKLHFNGRTSLSLDNQTFHACCYVRTKWHV